MVDHEAAWSPEQVWDVADRIAHLARAATTPAGGAAPTRRVAVFAENAATSVVAHLGGLRSGASVVAVNSHLAAPEVAYQLAVADVTALADHIVNGTPLP